MKKFLKYLFITLLLLLFLLSFSTSYEALNIDNLAIVVALGVDTTDTNTMKLSFQFSNASPSSESGSSGNDTSTIYTIEANSISSGINLMNTYLEKKLTLSHCKLFAFSEEFAQNGISNEIYTLINTPEVRPSANIIITKTTAKSYIETTKPVSQNLLSEYYDIFTGSSEFTGYTTNATIGNFFLSLECEFCEPFAILGGISSTSTKTTSPKDTSGKSNDSALFEPTTSEHTGSAVFKNDVLIGELNSLETLSLLAIKNELYGFLITIPDPLTQNSYLDIYLTPSRTATSNVDIINNTPYITANYSFTGRIESMDTNSSYLDKDNLEIISRACNSYLTDVFSTFLYKTSKEFNSDICSFGKSSKSSFFTINEAESFNWSDKYKDSFFDVNVNTNIKSGSLLNGS